MAQPQQQQEELDSVAKTVESSISLTCDRDPQSEAQLTTTTTSSSDPSLSRNLSLNSRLNAQAPEFVPGSSSMPSSSGSSKIVKRIQVYNAPSSPVHVPVPFSIPVQNHHQLYSTHHIPLAYPHSHSHQQYYGSGGGGSVGFANVDHHPQEAVSTPKSALVDSHQISTSENGLPQEATNKIINQVEYYFSDVNLATTDHLMRFINKDPNGYVPISVVASFKKIKALINSNSQLASILRNSTKLVVSEDGKKIRRKQLLTESDMEELQSRIVVAENLPEDHCHQNLMRIFSAVGSVKTIRTCQPQSSNSGGHSASRSPKVDGMLVSNKLHAFVEYESVELAEKAIVELNNEGNWRNGLKVRLLLRRNSKSGQARVKKVSNGDIQDDDDDATTAEQQKPKDKHFEDPTEHLDAPSIENTGQGEDGNDKESGQKKGGRGHGRSKGRGRTQHTHHHNHNTRGGHVGSPPASNTNPVNNLEQVTVSKQPPGPRMPDGTRGFSMGRGKPC